MKKVFFTIILLMTLVLTGCSNGNLKTISASDLNEKLNNKESFVLYFAKSDSTLEKTLKNVLKEYDLTGYKIDISKLDDKEMYDLKLKFSYNDPSIVFVIKGEDTGVLSHVTDSDTLSKSIVKRLMDMNFIKEE